MKTASWLAAVLMLFPLVAKSQELVATAALGTPVPRTCR